MKKGILGTIFLLVVTMGLAGIATAEIGVTDSEIVIGSHLWT